MSKRKGRPRSSPLPRTEFISLRLNNLELKSLQDYCERYDLSHSEVIRSALMLLSVIPDNPLGN